VELVTSVSMVAGTQRGMGRWQAIGLTMNWVTYVARVANWPRLCAMCWSGRLTSHSCHSLHSGHGRTWLHTACQFVRTNSSLPFRLTLWHFSFKFNSIY